ncbi:MULTISPECIES: hypothetical protein [unclassified Streptomyces]|uniref:hypothetical protein n=1 Tax=unclassified Streptomyces TaxID=2593676 RepID=UPI0011E702A0|nr:hypothetical protein [Streptomyces sp. sk2.1]TXS68559.1 hypothetical protein EAO76_26965 [Streptomyces sp. sk2.1]
MDVQLVPDTGFPEPLPFVGGDMERESWPNGSTAKAVRIIPPGPTDYGTHQEERPARREHEHEHEQGHG